VWDAATGKALGEPMRHKSNVLSAVFSPDGGRVLTASADDTAQVWDAATGKALGEPMRHKGVVRSAVFSPDGGRVVTASDDRTARVWDASTGKALGEPMRHEGGVESAVFSPDGRRVVTVDYRTARVWDTPPGTAQEAPVLARLLEALGRHRVNDLGALEEIPSKAMPESWSDLQREAETSPDNDTKRVIRWLLADPATRPASPLAMPVPATRVK